jgi:hypothetical protein
MVARKNSRLECRGVISKSQTSTSRIGDRCFQCLVSLANKYSLRFDIDVVRTKSGSSILVSGLSETTIFKEWSSNLLGGCFAGRPAFSVSS